MVKYKGMGVLGISFIADRDSTLKTLPSGERLSQSEAVSRIFSYSMFSSLKAGVACSRAL